MKNPKPQNPSSKQASSSKSQMGRLKLGAWSFSEAWSLGFGALWGIGIWFLGFSPSARAQSLVLSNAIIHRISDDTLPSGKLLIQDGKIAAVGPNISAANAQVIDLQGQHLYPGLIALNTSLGLTEIAAVRATQDSSEVGDYTPDVESWISANPDSELIPVARANGIAYFEPVPQGGIVAGQSGLVATDGWTTEQRTIKRPLTLHVFWPAQELTISTRARGRGKEKGKSLDEQAKERRTKLRALEDFFDEAKAYARAKDAAGSAADKSFQSVPAWEAMLPYVRGQLPITVQANEIRQIKSAVSWATTNNYKIILAGARDAWMAADMLAARNIPVIYANTFARPVRDTSSYDVHFKAADVLRRAGVKVIFNIGSDSGNASMSRNLPYSASQAVAFGLPEIEALKGLTLYPAQVAGVADRLGSLEVGKEATIIATDGSILDQRANVKHMWLAGKEVSLESRHTRLYEKYKNRPRP
jgi:imidazolonepropionase-like amidohydrolase